MLEALNTLLIDDNPDDAFLMEAALDEAPDLAFRLTWVQRLGAGLEKLRDGGWAVVLLDLHLPKVDGLEVLRRLRADERWRTLPVVVLTSSDEEEDVARSYSLGANSYVRKPVEFSRFTESVRQLGIYWLMLNEAPQPGG